MKAVIKDNKNIIISKLNSQELAVLTNFLEKASYYKAELSELRNIDNEYDGLNINITNIPKQEIQYNSPYNITLLPNTIANIDLGVDAETEIEITNEYSEYLNVELLSNKTINVNLIEDEELRNSFKTYKLGFKLSKETFEDINLEIQVNAIYSYSGASKMSELENDIGLIDNTVDDLVNYYTKTETDDLLDTKQDTLTAGTNITIENGTISAIDTIYDDTQIRTDISNIESDINNLESDKVDKIQGKGLSTNDYTDEEKSKLASLENYDDTELRNDISNLNNTKANKSELPINVSELNNDADYTTKKYVDDNIPDVSNFITNSVDDLVNYYKKSETYTQTEVNTLIGNIQHFHYEIVQSLPQSGETNVIYLVPKSTSQTNNYYDEYVYANNAWEKIGDTEIDLSSYITTDALNSALQEYTTTTDLTTLLASKQDSLVSGTNIKTINNTSLLGSGDIKTEIIQYSTLPTASIDNLGKIVQYTGTTTQDFTSGYFYQVVSDGEATPTYSWENINVQPAGSTNDLYVIKGRISYLYNNLQLNDFNTADNRAIYTILYNKIATDGADTIDTSKIKFYDSWNDQYYSVSEFSYWKSSDRLNLVFKISYTGSSKSYGVSYQWYNDLYIYGVRTNGEVTSLTYQKYKYSTLRHDDQLIAKDNTQAFTPTGDYNPATKKYVDDQVGAINTILATLTTPSNNGGE